MVRAARQHGKVLAIAFNRRHRHDVALLKQHVAAGKLGRVYYAKAFWMRRAGIPGFGSWFTRQEQAGGGPLIDLGVHVLDMALYLMGNPRVLSVSAATYAELGPRGRGVWSGSRFQNDVDLPYEVEDLATAFIRLEEYDYPAAAAIAVVLLATAFCILLATNAIQAWHLRYKVKG